MRSSITRHGFRAAVLSAAAVALVGLTGSGEALAQSCERTITAKVVAFDQPLMFNRLGASNINGMMYALRGDVVDKTTGKPEAAGGTLSAGNVMLRPDKRPRPLVLRAAAGDCLTVEFTNLLDPNSNPRHAPDTDANGVPFNVQLDDQVADRHAGFHPQGLELLGGIASDSSFVGQNASSLANVGETKIYEFYAREEGTFMAWSHGATFGGDGTGGQISSGLFAAVNVQPKGAGFFRSQVTEEDLRLASTDADANGFPEIDYHAVYPAAEPWLSEGKAGQPIINMVNASGEYVHSDINAIVAYTGGDFVMDGAGLDLGRFPASTYPLESKGLRNPTVPTRLEAFREFTVIFHDEVGAGQAFPAWFNDPVLRHTLHGVRDAFMINYGSGGIGSEIIANRLGVGPMHDCLDCAYEEFFLAASTVGDVGMLVDVPANLGLEACDPALNNCAAVGPKANVALYPDDPSNVHHSYTNDAVKFRNLHAGPKEQHVFHLHNHQWLFNANDDNSNYLDAQGIGPGSGYTYEINFGGSGNRNKTSGDAIFHCHFYPHFAMGMWEMWRVHDVLETGTELAASGGAGFHAAPFELGDSPPAAGSRALPDGEILAGTPIPAVVPLPGKPLAPLPGRVQVVQKDANGDGIPESSQAQVIDRDQNPGYPFWIAGIEDTVGQRSATPPLDMDPTAGGVDGGLPRHTLDGYAAGGTSIDTQNRLDFSKVITTAKPVYYPEDGTDVEKVAMAFHAERCHDSALADGTPANCDPASANDSGKLARGGFVTNGQPATAGAPYNEPCIDDEGDLFLTGQPGDFFDEVLPQPGFESLTTVGTAEFGADAPRIYKAAVIQTDVVFNKTGYHFPQQRIIVLNEDVAPTLDKVRPPEPFVIRLNTFDCANFLHTNLVPEVYELDDYQVRTPTDIIGQHIHLPKWDLTAADGSANGWNYEDGTLSPGMVRERIEAINHFNEVAPTPVATLDGRTHLEPEAHPFFGAGPNGEWLGARTTIQRWFADPVVNVQGVDRGLGIIFTHDHYGPSTHQQVGLYATVLIEPARSDWVHNETGEPLYTRDDGGPTSWQVAILPEGNAGDPEPYREFYFEFADFQHAYQADVFVGVGPDGHTVIPPTTDSFMDAINPSFRQEANDGPGNPKIFPDIVRWPTFCPGGVPRPCPEAISADDPGMLVVNYRNEPVGLRVYDPNKLGPDGKPGSQADGVAGDLAFALASVIDTKDGDPEPIVRAIPEMNKSPAELAFTTQTLNAPNAVKGGDPFTPMLRVHPGDMVRVKAQAGAHEHEHNSIIHGVEWLQSGSGFGSALNSGWRNAQNAGISEQFTFAVPMNPVVGAVKNVNTDGSGLHEDYAYSVDASQDGWWSGMWGVMRAYREAQPDLFTLPNNPDPKAPQIVNSDQFNGVCPVTAPVRSYTVVAMAANDVLDNPVGATLVPNDSSATMHVGGPLDPNGGTLVYNPRPTTLQTFDVGGKTIGGQQGPLHDPTALLYFNAEDLEPKDPSVNACQIKVKGKVVGFDVTNPECPVKLKDGVKPGPLMLRAAAGECVEATLVNRMPEVAPDLAGVNTLLGVVRRNFDPVNGMTSFNNNLIRPSSHVGLHAQLVEYDVSQHDGTNVGANIVQTVGPPVLVNGKLKLDKVVTYRYYAGQVDAVPEGNNIRLVATPVEFGATNLIPADKVKQGQKAMIGALIVEPEGSSWVEDAGNRTSATVTEADGTTFRDFAVVAQKGLNHRFGDGSYVPNIASEGQGIPEDSHDAGQIAVNYASEPLWFRFGRPADAPFGRAGGAGFGDVANAHEAYSNGLVGGDPVTPVFTAKAGDEIRMRLLEPTGVGRGTTFNLHGHLWERDPYVCPGDADLGLAGKCAPGSVGSQAIGDNPIGWYLGGQESVTPGAHFDVVTNAGGSAGVSGDYLFRDQASFGNLGGYWGIVRVGPTQP